MQPGHRSADSADCRANDDRSSDGLGGRAGLEFESLCADLVAYASTANKARQQVRVAI